MQIKRLASLTPIPPLPKIIQSLKRKLTINGCHLNEFGYHKLAKILYKDLTGKSPPALNQDVRAAVIEKNTQHFYRFRPLNTFYYTGGRRGSYGYLDSFRLCEILIS